MSAQTLAQPRSTLQPATPPAAFPETAYRTRRCAACGRTGCHCGACDGYGFIRGAGGDYPCGACPDPRPMIMVLDASQDLQMQATGGAL